MSLLLASGGAASPQRLPFWWASASSLVALGLFDLGDVPRVDAQALYALRLPSIPASGHFVTQANQLVLVEPEFQIRRSDHSAALFNRAAPSTQVGAPWYLWQSPRAQPVEELSVPRTDHTLLHLYRQAFQTVGQPAWLFHWRSNRPDTSDPSWPPPDRSPDLHRYRQSFQTVGQPWLTWPPYQAPRLEPEGFATKPTDQTILYGRTTPIVAQPGQPWFMWLPPPPRLEAEGAPPQRSNHDALHLYRTRFQTVGQPWSMLWRPTQVPVFEPEAILRPPVDLTPFRQVTLAATGKLRVIGSVIVRRLK